MEGAEAKGAAAKGAAVEDAAVGFATAAVEAKLNAALAAFTFGIGGFTGVAGVSSSQDSI